MMMAFKIDVPWAELKPLFRYFNEAMNCKCFPDLLERELFPNAKEITESFAAYRAVRYGVLRKHFDLGDKSNLAVVVGDGSTPRTGAVFAFRTAWQVISIDPKMRLRPWRISRLKTHLCTVEDWKGVTHRGNVLIVGVHSHALLDNVLQKVNATVVGRRSVISIPCCVRQFITKGGGGELPPDIEYRDRGIWSPENQVKIWLNV